MLSNEIIRGKLLSEDGTLALIVLSLDPKIVSGKGLNDNGRRNPQDHAGRPRRHRPHRAALRRAGHAAGDPQRRRARPLLYNAIGFAAGCLIAILFFRRISFMIIAAAPPLIAILLSLGALGWLNFRLNMFLNVMTPLIMVISFSDSMQLTFAARDRLIAGKDKYQGVPRRRAGRRAGLRADPRHGRHFVHRAAVLQLRADPHLRRGRADRDGHRAARRAVAGAAARRAADPQRRRTSPSAAGAPTSASKALRSFCRWVAVRMVSRPGLYSLIGLLVVVGLSVVYINLEPRYRLADQVPDKRQAVEASGRLDAKLTGANPIDVLIEFPKGASLYDDQTLAAIAEVHAIVETAGRRRQRLVARIRCAAGSPKRPARPISPR